MFYSRFCLPIILLLCVTPVFAQIERAKTNAPAQKAISNAQRVQTDSILPLEVSNRYKRLIQREEINLKNSFKANLSRELELYADTTYAHACWYKNDTRFKNTTTDFDDYLKLLREANQLYQRKQLSNADRMALVNNTRSIQQLYRRINPVDAEGKPQECYVVYSSMPRVLATINVRSTKIQKMSNVRMVLTTEPNVNNCDASCKSKPNSLPPNTCSGSDMTCMKNRSGTVELYPGIQASIPPVSNYQIFVIERVRGVDVVWYYTTRNITTSPYSDTISF